MFVKALRRHARLVVASAAALLACPLGTLRAANQVSASASGAGQTTVDGELRTFSFIALENDDDVTVGMAEVDNRSVGEMFQIDVDCLNVVGDTAIVSGVFTRHTDEHAIGLTGVFAVVDGGEGAGHSTDLITQVFFFPPGIVTCLDFSPDDAAPFLVPIEAGNVQVR